MLGMDAENQGAKSQRHREKSMKSQRFSLGSSENVNYNRQPLQIPAVSWPNM